MIVGLNSLFICNTRQCNVLFASIFASSVLLTVIGPCLSELTSVDEANVCGPKSIDVVQTRTVRVSTVCPEGTCQVTRLQYFLTTKYYLHCCAGFSQTNTSCSQACELGRFGENCTESCDCESNRCNSVDGICECMPGYKGINCTELCEKGYYGVNCRGNCTCQNGGTCDLIDGKCKCPTGFSGENCEMVVEIIKACEPGRFGENCTESCDCASNRCNPLIGTCECLPGYKVGNCTEQCEKGTYGLNCSGNCTCLNGGTCNLTDGTCNCPTGIFGENCEVAVKITTATIKDPRFAGNGGQTSIKSSNIVIIPVTVVCSFLVIVVVCFMIAWRLKWISICKPNNRPNPNLSAPVNDEVTINPRGPEAIPQIYMNDITHTYSDTIITTPPPNQWNNDPVAYAESSAFRPQPPHSNDGMRSPAANGDEQYAYAYGHTTPIAASPSAHPSGNAIENEDNNVARSTAPTGIANSSQSLYVNDKLIKQRLQRQRKMSSDL